MADDVLVVENPAATSGKTLNQEIEAALSVSSKELEFATELKRQLAADADDIVGEMETLPERGGRRAPKPTVMLSDELTKALPADDEVDFEAAGVLCDVVPRGTSANARLASLSNVD